MPRTKSSRQFGQPVLAEFAGAPDPAPYAFILPFLYVKLMVSAATKPVFADR